MTAFLSPITYRFAWKEFRTLRGFWIAALVLGALVQWFGYAVHDQPPNTSWPAALFSIALAATALYAVGVASTTFSMEHEEETYAFLAGLPTRWLPIFAGKMLFALTSAISLAAALTFVGWLLTGGELPDRSGALFALGTFGFAIIEALAWGTFFSLIMRQPLLAALLAMGAQSLALTWITSTFAEGSLPSIVASSYIAVLPQRIVLALCVFALDILLARRWLKAGNRPPRTLVDTLDGTAPPSSLARSWSRLATRIRNAIASNFSLKLFSHLLWQTWRQSWRLMLAMPAIVALFCFAFYAFTNGARINIFIPQDQIALLPFVTGLVATALYTSVVFHADQRGQKYRFLAEHAAWPRYVWLARLTIWLLPIAVLLAIAVALAVSGAYDLQQTWQRQLQWLFRDNYWWDKQYIRQQWQDAQVLTRGLLFSLWAILIGVALGQAASLFFRRALVAGFAAMVLSLPLLLWGLAIWTWELPGDVFLLPLVVGLLTATWLRTPGWIVDRNSPRAWLKVAAAILIPLLFIAWQLPAARRLPAVSDQIALTQIAGSPTLSGSSQSQMWVKLDLPAIVTGWTNRFNAGITAADLATGDRLIRLGELIDSSSSPKRTADKPDPTPAEWSAFTTAKVNLNRTVLDEAVTLSNKRLAFPPLFDLNSKTESPIFSRLSTLVDLLSDAGVLATKEGKLDNALKYHLAALRLWERLWNRAPTSVTPSSWNRNRLQSWLVDWAADDGQTTSQIHQAILEVDAIYAPLGTSPAIEKYYVDGPSALVGWTPPGPLVTDYVALREILLGKQPSNLLTPSAGLFEYAAVVANQLPFERTRALKLLENLFIVRTAQWYEVVAHIDQARLQRTARENIAQHGDGVLTDVGNATRARIQLAYESSYDRDQYIGRDLYPPFNWLRTTVLLREELQRLGSFGRWLQSVVDAQVAGWGLRQQLALVAYRLDHGQYPDTLAALAPDYLPFIPVDPYSGRPFEYRPKGLPLVLRGRFGSESDIAADTPFLWSLGALNAQLERQSRVEAVDTSADPYARTSEIRHDEYVLSGTALGSWDYLDDSLVFPLPK